MIDLTLDDGCRRAATITCCDLLYSGGNMLNSEEKKIRLALNLIEAITGIAGCALMVYAAGWIAGFGLFLSAFACNIKTQQLFLHAKYKKQ